MKKPSLLDNGRFQQVATEFASGHISGSDYGARVRILLRSPTKVLFTGVGVTIWTLRGSKSHHSLLKLTWDRASIAVFDAPFVRNAIKEQFGEGADDAAMLAWRAKGNGTVLVDGGGEPMPLPANMHRRNVQERHAAVTPTCDVDLTGSIAVCRQCGENLKPDVEHHRLGNKHGADHPRSLEDCQKLTNQRVVRVRGVEARNPEKSWPFVEGFDTWDGESLIDPDFCNARCAAIYGRRAVQELDPLPIGGSPKPHPRKVSDFIDHDPKESRTVTMKDGSTFRI